MSGNEDTTNTNNDNSGGTGFTPITSQADLDRTLADRLNRERSKFSGFDDYKAKAEKFDALQKDGSNADDAFNARLSEFEQRMTTAERNAADSAAELIRLQVATDKGITKDDLVLLTASTKEALEAQADRIVRLNAGSGRVPGQGGRDTTATGGTVASGREIFEARRKPKS